MIDGCRHRLNAESPSSAAETTTQRSAHMYKAIRAASKRAASGGHAKAVTALSYPKKAFAKGLISFCIVFGSQSGWAGGFVKDHQVWLVPVFLEIATIRSVRYSRSIDSTVARVRFKRETIVIDYGVSSNNVQCPLQAAHDEVVAVCTRKVGPFLQIEIEDPVDRRFSVRILTRPVASTISDNARMILRTMEFIGAPSELKVISADVNSKTAVVSYENGVIRKVTVGQTVTRDYGVFSGIRGESVQIKSYALGRDDSFNEVDYQLSYVGTKNSAAN